MANWSLIPRFFSNTVSSFLKKRILSGEALLFCVFVLAQILVNTNKLYLLLIVFYAIGLYLISRNALKTAWFTFISLLLFQQAKYFIETISIPTSQSYVNIPVLYNIMFSDISLLFVLFFIWRGRASAVINKKVGSVELLFIPIIIVGLISTWLSYFPNISLFYLIQIVKYFVIFIISGIILNDKNIKKISFEILFLFVLFNGTLICLQALRGGPFGLPIEHLNLWSQLGRFAVEQTDIYRPGGTFDDPNLAASVIGMIFPILLAVGLARSIFNRSFVWITLAAAAMGLLFTGSRAVWLISVLVCFFGIYMCKRLYKKIRLPILPSPRNILYVILISSIVLPFIMLRLSTLSSTFTDTGSGTYRLKHLEIATNYLLSFPFGIGLNVFEYLTPMRYEAKDYVYQIAEPHNIFAQIGSELGIFGLLLFCYVFSRIISHKYKIVLVNKKPLSIGILLGCISYLGIACFYPWFLYAPVSELFWLFMGAELYGTKNVS